MQVIPTKSLAPPPPWGQGWRKGGGEQKNRLTPASHRFFLQKFDLLQNFSGSFGFRPELFWNFQISNRKKTGRKTFSPKFFTIFNFQPENFPVFQISRPKKVRVLGNPGPGNRSRFTTVMPVSCQTDNLFSNFRANFFFFFQLSIQNFLGFSTFEPKKFRPTNFRTKNFCPEKISNRTGRTRSAGSTCNGLRVSAVKPATKAGFSNFRGDRFKIFRRESPYKFKNFRDNSPKKSKKAVPG